MSRTAIIVLAAGKGKRLEREIPKPLVDLEGQPIVKYLLDSIKESQMCERPTIVVGNSAELVQETLGPSYSYVYQAEQLGTGHAVQVCQEALEGTVDNVVVLYADHPLVSSEMIKELVSLREQKGSVISMATLTVPDYEDWRLPFYSYGRVVRNEHGDLSKIVERKDANDDELKICEVSPSFFCFDATWLWENLKAIKNDNAQSEYYLPDLIGMAWNQNIPIASMSIDPVVAIGINTEAELEIARRFITQAQ